MRTSARNINRATCEEGNAIPMTNALFILLALLARLYYLKILLIANLKSFPLEGFLPRREVSQFLIKKYRIPGNFIDTDNAQAVSRGKFYASKL